MTDVAKYEVIFDESDEPVYFESRDEALRAADEQPAGDAGTAYSNEVFALDENGDPTGRAIKVVRGIRN